MKTTTTNRQWCGTKGRRNHFTTQIKTTVLEIQPQVKRRHGTSIISSYSLCIFPFLSSHFFSQQFSSVVSIMKSQKRVVKVYIFYIFCVCSKSVTRWKAQKIYIGISRIQARQRRMSEANLVQNSMLPQHLYYTKAPEQRIKTWRESFHSVLIITS